MTLRIASLVSRHLPNLRVLRCLLLPTVASIMTAKADDVVCRRLGAVQGLEDKVNDVIFCGKASIPESNVIFFGGDVQDYVENMESHRDNHRYKEWNLEATAQLLHRRFPNSHIWVVKPLRMHLNTFSVYQNFVECNDFSAPTHDNEHGGLEHLSKLFPNAVASVNKECHRHNDGHNGQHSQCLQKEMSDHPNVWTSDAKEIKIESSASKPLVLIAFSKGCIVLNQFLYELENVKENPEVGNFVKNIHSMVWLDGGHAGGSNTWIVHHFVLKNLVGLDLEIVVHVTPYQVKDEMRSWIGKEERKFVDRLKKLGVKVTETLHFEDEPRSLENHFKVLCHF